MGGGLGKKKGRGGESVWCVCVCAEADPDGATDVRAAAALLCRQTEALSRVPSPSLCSALTLPLSASKGFSFAPSRSSEVTPAQTAPLTTLRSWEARRRSEGGRRWTIRAPDHPLQRRLSLLNMSLRRESLLTPAAIHLINLQLALLPAALEAPLTVLRASHNFPFNSACQKKLPFQFRCINTGTATSFPPPPTPFYMRLMIFKV